MKAGRRRDDARTARRVVSEERMWVTEHAGIC